jgi:hypothetical protein
MHSPLPFRAQRLSAALFALLCLGCSSPLDPTTPVATSDLHGATGTGGASLPAKDGFYPLAVSNRWSYRRLESLRLITYGEPPAPPTTFVSNSQREISCIETMNGRQYAAERNDETTPYGGTTTWRRYRQDASGLYELDGAGDVPPVCWIFPEPGARAPSTPHSIWDRVTVRSDAERRAVEELRARVARVEAFTRPGSGPALGLPIPQAQAGELTRLHYPLQIKSRWFIRTDPAFPFTAQVEGLDALDLPAGRLTGYRIRLGASLYGPNDFVAVWYGPVGYLQTRAHIELALTDIEGNFVGIAEFDQIERLTDYELVPATSPFPPRGGPPR